MALRLALLVSVFLTLAAPAVAAPVVHVAPGGSDAAAGTASRPFGSIGRALAALPDGGTVRVAPGSYPALADGVRRQARVVVRGWRGRPRIAGLELSGASRLRFERLTIAGPAMITNGSSDISLRRVEITAPGRNCLIVRSASRRIDLRRLHIHHCVTGLGGPGGAPISSRITLSESRLEHFTQDAIQFGRWDDVTIRGNRISDITDPVRDTHNDAIQFTGDSRRVRILDNELTRSEHQLLFVQDALGPIDDVVVRGNLIHDAGAYAIQVQGVTRLRFTENTVWRSRWGGLLVRRGMHGLRPNDAVVEGNILSGLEVDRYVTLGSSRRNVLACGFPGAGDPCATDATFTGGYRVRRGTTVGKTPAGPRRLRAAGHLRWPLRATSGPIAVRTRDD